MAFQNIGFSMIQIHTSSRLSSRLTLKRGFDLILNISQDGNDLRQLWSSVAPLGQLVHAGRNEIMSENVLDIGPFQRGCRFSVVDLSVILQNDPATLIELSYDFATFMKQNRVKPLEPLNVFPAKEVAEAFKSTEISMPWDNSHYF